METGRCLEVNNLRTWFHTPEGVVKAVDGVSFHIEEGETLALVGESGCGKTITSLSLLRLLPETAELKADRILLNGRDVTQIDKTEARLLRGSQISMIFQEPMTSLNPVYRIEKQLGEVFRLHHPGISREEVAIRSVDQLSGGLRQRVMIAISLASNPRLVIADEPTTALDVTIQAQILDLLKQLQKDMNMSVLLITHDFGVVSQIARRVAVMYAGKIVEEGPMEDVFAEPWHPYTKLLILSIPGIKVTRGKRLESIKGTVPNPLRFPEGCRFAPRCPYATEACRKTEPPVYVEEGRRVSCFLFKRDTASN